MLMRQFSALLIAPLILVLGILCGVLATVWTFGKFVVYAGHYVGVMWTEACTRTTEVEVNREGDAS